jgi:hypothetical protein
MAAQKIHATTQKFTEIVDFVDNLVVLEGGAACMIIEITASNFALLSKREQDTRIYSYAAMLNSLSFPIQILIRNKRIDISSYLKELDDVQKTAKNELLANYIKLYRTFVHEMVTVNVVLNKAFYIVIPYSSLEGGATAAAAQTVQKGQKGKSEIEAFAETAKKTLQTKVDSVLGQLQKFATSARILEKPDLIKLFYDIYNNETNIEVDQVQQGVDTAIISTGGGK